MTVDAAALSVSEPLVPLLGIEGGAPDPVALATWHLALGSTTAVEIPHDIFALWLYPASGGAVLLGPEALAQDNVLVPLPDPLLLQDQIFELEQVLRKAKYASAIAVPVREGARDVGVMLLGSFQRGAFGPRQALALQALARKLTGTLSALGEVMAAVEPHAALDGTVTLETLPQHLAHVAAEATSGPDLVRRVSGVLYAIAPHDRLEILAVGTAEDSFLPLSGTAPRRRWSSSRSPDPWAPLVARFGSSGSLLVDDLTTLETDSSWTMSGDDEHPHEARSVLGAALNVGGRRVGYLLLGSVAANAFRPEDEDTLAMAALLVATRVSELRLAAELEARSPLPAPRSSLPGSPLPAPSSLESPLPAAASALAETAHLGEALSRFAEALKQALPHDRIVVHLRWGEDGVIALDAGALRPLADLPAEPAAAFHGAFVLNGGVEWMVRTLDDGEELVVPLVVAGRIIGTLGVQAASFEDSAEGAIRALEFAHILAPHLELIRRGAAASGPASREKLPVR